MVSGVATVWVPVSDLERAVGFYRDTLGLEAQNHDGDWAEVTTDGLTIGLNASEKAGAGADGGPVIAFTADDGLEQAVDALKEKGVDFPAEISEHPWGRVATFQDSEGNDLQLFEPPAD